ncbi:FAD/NAD(P)-binding domain-containing protein [Mycena vulgaris]|nr:FAD/NAD(P)-binding domain-containing protein [Mycena vulgaris]
MAHRRQGHQVEIFEATKNQIEIGSISIQKNALCILNYLGASGESFNGIKFDGLVMFESDRTEGFTQRWLIPQAAEDPGLFCNRKDLCEELRRLAIGQDGSGQPVNLRTGMKVVTCNPDEGTLTFEDGQVVHTDLILGGDGMGLCSKAPSSGWSCFRALFDVSKLDGIQELAWITEGVSGARFVGSKDEPFRAIFMNLCEDWSLINIVAIYLDSEQDSPGDQVTTREDVVQHFKDFHPNFLRILDLPLNQSFLRWKLLVLPELPTWTHGCAALLGDTAHAAFPSLGQGATIAVEEGGVLGCLLPLGTGKEDILARLEAFTFQSLCKPRGDFVRSKSAEQMLK